MGEKAVMEERVEEGQVEMGQEGREKREGRGRKRK